MQRIKKFGYLQLAAHVAAWVPLLVLVVLFFTNNLTFNPIQAATQRTGDIALILLVITLACTPVYIFFRYAPVLKLRRPLGLYTFMYALIHFLLFAVVDYGLDFPLILQTIVEKRFIVIGSGALLVLLALAVTSPNRMVRLLGKNWKRLHRLAYLAGILVVLHFAWARKGDLFSLSGDIAQPLLAGGILLVLLASRLPVVKRLAQRLRARLSGSQPVVFRKREG